MPTHRCRKSIQQAAWALVFAALAYGQQTTPAGPSPAPASGDRTQKPATTYESSTVLKVTTRLVVVDVVALDNKGRPVTDLKAEDFTLLEEGKEQKVRSFSLQQPTSPQPASTARVAPAKLPPHLFTNIPHYNTTGSLNVVLLDLLNTRATDQAYARDQMIKCLEKIPEGQPIAIYTLRTNLHLLQDFTSDPSLLKKAVQGLKDHVSPLMDNTPAFGYSAGLLEQMPEQMQRQVREFAQENSSFQTDNRVAVTVQVLKSLARTLAAYPGRKNLIWISETFPINILPDITPGHQDPGQSAISQRDYSAEVASMASALTDAQVAVYPVDTRALVNSEVYSNLSNTSSSGEFMGRTLSGQGAAGNAGIGNELGRTSDELLSTHSTMNDLADRTGGKAFYNGNDLSAAIRSSMEDGSTYYTLAYTPENTDWNGKFRKINVKVHRSGVKLRHRSGYFAMDPKAYSQLDAKQRALDLGQQLSLEFPVSTAMLFQVAVLPPSEKSNNKVVINYAIDPHAISFELKEDGRQHASVDCVVEVYSPQGKSLKTDLNGISAALDQDAFRTVMQHFLPCSQTIDLVPGEYLLRVGVRDNHTGLTGTANATVSVPPLPAATNTNPPEKTPQ